MFSLGFPEGEKVLVLAPHPDDEALGCSGTLFQLRKRGSSLFTVFMTSGEKLHGNASRRIAEIRKEEARRSSEMIGARQAFFLELPDGGVAADAGAYEALSRVVEEIKPEIVMSPSPIDYHEDHIATARIAMQLAAEFRSFTLAFYEVYSTVRFNYLVDITDVSAEKEKLIMNYRASLCEKPELYARAALGLNAQRSIFVQKEGYYEAFYALRGTAGENSIYDYLLYKTRQ